MQVLVEIPNNRANFGLEVLDTVAFLKKGKLNIKPISVLLYNQKRFL